MPGNNPLTESSQMAVLRSISSMPTRSPKQAWAVAAGLIAEAVEAREFPEAAKLRASLCRLSPLAGYLLMTHALDGGRVEFETNDLVVTVTFHYGCIEPADDLAPVPVDVLGPLPADAEFTLTFFTAAPIDEASLGKLLDMLKGAPMLKVLLIAADDAAPARPEDDINDPSTEGGNHGRHD